jgi:DNA-binding transcriptional ArsR family regulator
MHTGGLDSSNVGEHAAFFQALADPTRLKLLTLLCTQSQPPHALCVKALAVRLGVSQPAVSQHLRVLRALGLVKGDRRGYHVHYSVDTDRLRALWEQAGSLLGSMSDLFAGNDSHQHCRNGRQYDVPCG